MSPLSLIALAVAPSWTLVAGGDLMLNAIPPGPKVFGEISPILKEADLAIANLEIPLTDSRTPTTRKSAAEVKARSQFILKASPKHGPFLAQAGFDLMSLGNNHTLDYGPAGLKQTTDLLDQGKIGWSGAGMDSAIAERVAVYEVKEGFKVGMISYLSFLTQGAMAKCDPAGPKDPGVATLTVGGSTGREAHLKVRGIIRKARKECDFLIVMLHWGAERQPQPRPYQVSLGRLFVEEGADAVIGHHPHVLQPGELFRGKPIVYSLGNFIAPTGGASALYRFEFEGRTFKGVSAIPTTFTSRGVKPSKGNLEKMRMQETTFRRLFPSKDSKRLL